MLRFDILQPAHLTTPHATSPHPEHTSCPPNPLIPCPPPPPPPAPTSPPSHPLPPFPLQRKALGELLEDLLDALLGAGLIRGKAQLIEARVPIIKACLAVGACRGGGAGIMRWRWWGVQVLVVNSW